MVRTKVKHILAGLLGIHVSLIFCYTAIQIINWETISVDDQTKTWLAVKTKFEELHGKMRKEYGTDDENDSDVMFTRKMSVKELQGEVSREYIHDDEKNADAFMFGHTVNASSDCSGMGYPEYLGRRDTWLPVDDRKDAYVFSAFHDEMFPSRITLFGAKTSKRVDYFCQLWYLSEKNNSVTMKEVGATAQVFSEGHGRRYTSCKFLCNLPSKRTPFSVSVLNKSCSKARNLLPINEIKQKPYLRHFTVCVTPFNFRYGRAYELVEWIELNKILGADYFVFYNYSSASNVAQVLGEYSKRGLTEVVQWQLPMGVDTWPRTKGPVEIHYFGQLAVLNECLLRNKEQSKYIAYLDLDEFIIPHSNTSTSWTDLLEDLPNHGAYIFQNTFFRKEWDSSDNNVARKELADKYRLVSLLKLEREKKIFRARQRSKYIVRSNAIESLGIHDIRGTARGQSVFNVPPTIGLLHHYRNWNQYNDTQPRVKDDIILIKYKDILIDNVANVWSELKNVEMDIPVQ